MLEHLGRSALHDTRSVRHYTIAHSGKLGLCQYICRNKGLWRRIICQHCVMTQTPMGIMLCIDSIRDWCNMPVQIPKSAGSSNAELLWHSLWRAHATNWHTSVAHSPNQNSHYCAFVLSTTAWVSLDDILVMLLTWHPLYPSSWFFATTITIFLMEHLECSRTFLWTHQSGWLRR